MQPDGLRVPTFARLDDYAGYWLMEPRAFELQWQTLMRLDLAAHVKAAKKNPPEPKAITEMVSGKGGRQIAIVSLAGTLMKQKSSAGGTSTIQARREVRMAAADPNVSGILVAIDSPGGTVAGTGDLARDVKAASKKKPTWAFVEDLCASAAYEVASQTDKIFANDPNALVGSIGTILTVYDESAAYEQQGVKVFNFATGPLKAAGRSGNKITDEQQTYFQGLVDGMQEEFDNAVRSGRSMSKKELDAVRTGGVFHASKAIGLKLVDGIQTFEKTIQGLMGEIDKPAERPGARVFFGLPTLRRQGLPMLEK